MLMRYRKVRVSYEKREEHEKIATKSYTAGQSRIQPLRMASKHIIDRVQVAVVQRNDEVVVCFALDRH